MNEERMRDLYARNAARRAASDPPCEVSLEAMIDVLEHRGSEDERRRIMGEILRSPACREEFELLRAVVRASQPVKAPSWWQQVAARRLLAAAAIIAVAGLGLAVALRRGPEPEPLRGGPSPLVIYGPAEGSTLGTPRVFRWGRLSGAVEYTFELVDQAGQVGFTTTGADTTVTIPASQSLAPGRYLWVVVARMPDGQTVRSEARGVVVER
jgi:hypothetical protein